MAEPTPIWTPPRPLFRHAHPTRLDRASIDSSSSLATTNLQTPDRANFPRFASPIAEAGPSCERHAEGVEGSEEESVWEDMESGGLLEVKIGNLLNLTPRLSNCFLPTIAPSSELAFDQDYEVQPDDSPLLPASYISPQHATHQIPSFSLLEPRRPAGPSKRIIPRRNRPSTSDAASSVFGGSSIAPPSRLVDPFVPASSSMGRSTSDHAGMRPLAGKGLGINFDPHRSAPVEQDTRREAYQTSMRAQRDYLGRLSFGDASLSIPLPTLLSGSPATSLRRAEKGKGRMSEREQNLESLENFQERVQGKGEGDGNHLTSPISSSASLTSSKLFYSNHHTRTPSSSSTFSFAASLRSTGSGSSRRSGPPRSIPSRTSSRQSAIRPPPVSAFSPPPRSSSLAIAATSRPSSSRLSELRGNRVSVYTIASVISDRSDIVPEQSEVLSGGQVESHYQTARPATGNRSRRQAIYLSRSTSHPLESALSTFAEVKDLEATPTAAWALRPPSTSCTLRRTCSAPLLRPKSGHGTHAMSSSRRQRGLRASQSFVAIDTPSSSRSGMVQSMSRKLLSSPASSVRSRLHSSTDNNAPPTPGSPFRSRASRLGLSESWGSRLNPQGIMHIAEPRSSHRNTAAQAEEEEQEQPSSAHGGVQGQAPMLDIDNSSELDFHIDMANATCVSPTRAPRTPEDEPVVTPSQPRHVRTRSQRGIEALAAVRKARMLASTSSRTLDDGNDFAVADILSEIEAEDEQHSLFLAEREDDMAAWEEAQSWDWPMPPLRPALVQVDPPSQIIVENTVRGQGQSAAKQGLGVGMELQVREPRFLQPRHREASAGLEGTERKLGAGLGLQVREPKFLKPRPLARAASSGQGKGEQREEQKRESLQSSGSHGSLTSGDSSNSIAESALLTPAAALDFGASYMGELDSPTPTSSSSAGYGFPSTINPTIRVRTPSIHVECPSTPTAPSVPLKDKDKDKDEHMADMNMDMDMDVTPKAPSRRDSPRTMRTHVPDQLAYRFDAPQKSAPLMPSSYKPLHTGDDEREAPRTLRVSPRKYGSTASLPLLAAHTSGGAATSSFLLGPPPADIAAPSNVLSNSGAQDAQDGNVDEGGEVRERKESTFKAWARRRKEAKRQQDAEAQAAKAKARASGLLLSSASTLSLRPLTSDSKSATGTGTGKAGADVKGEEGDKIASSGSRGRGAGPELLGANTLPPAAAVKKSVRPQKSTPSLRTAIASAVPIGAAVAGASASASAGAGAAGQAGYQGGTASANGSIKSVKTAKRRPMNHLDILAGAGLGMF